MCLFFTARVNLLHCFYYQNQWIKSLCPYSSNLFSLTTAEAVAQKKAKKKLKEWAAASGTPGPFKYNPESPNFTSVKSVDKSSRKSAAKSPKRVSETYEEEVVTTATSETNEDPSSEEEVEEGSPDRGKAGRKQGRPAKRPLSRRFTHKKTHTVSRPPPVRITSHQDEHVDVETMSEVAREIAHGEEQVKKEAEKTIAHNEKFVLDLLSKAQPFHDHSYTTVFGKRHGIETLQLDAETLDELSMDDDTTRTSGNEHICFGFFKVLRVHPKFP